jgi:hypothetical protein
MKFYALIFYKFFKIYNPENCKIKFFTEIYRYIKYIKKVQKYFSESKKDNSVLNFNCGRYYKPKYILHINIKDNEAFLLTNNLKLILRSKSKFYVTIA